MKFYKQKDGEWVRPRRGYKLMCCDCGLVHNMDFRVRDNKTEFRAFRNNRSTALARRGYLGLKLKNWADMKEKKK